MDNVWQGIITAGAVLSAILLIVGLFTKGHKWFLKQEHQDDRINELKTHHDDDMQRVRQELYIVMRGLSACLDGLIQQGCNHDVPGAKKMIDDYLNQQAHE